LDKQDGAEHVEHESDRDQAGQESNQQCDSPENFEHRDEGTHHSRQRDAHLRKGPGRATQAVDGEHRLAVAQAKVEQPMVQMAAIGTER